MTKEEFEITVDILSKRVQGASQIEIAYINKLIQTMNDFYQTEESDNAEADSNPG